MGRMPFSMLSSSGMGSANLTANRTDLMSRIPMTSQDLQELERVQLEWYAARDAFEKAVQDGESLAEIDEALNRLQQKTAAYHAFGAKHIGPPPV